MGADEKPKTSLANGRLWGARAQDWASIQEGPAHFVLMHHALPVSEGCHA